MYALIYFHLQLSNSYFFFSNFEITQTMMNAASRFPFTLDAYASNRSGAAGLPRADNNPSCRSVGLGINSYEQPSNRNNSVSSASSHGHSSPWFTSHASNAAHNSPVPGLPVSQMQQMQHQRIPQASQIAQAQCRLELPSQNATAAQWIAPSDNSSPKSLNSLDSSYELAQKLEEKEAMVSDLKLQVEALMTAITLGGTPEVGSMDGAELAHRILTRIKSLRSENERLMTLASHNHAARLEVELDQLKQENATLRKQLSQ